MAAPFLPLERKRPVWLWALALTVALLLVVWWMLPQTTTTDQAKSSAVTPAPSQTLPESPPPSGPAEPLATASPGPSASRMVAISLKFQNGRLIETARQEFAGAVRPLRGIEGQSGLYHRIVDPAGRVLFENLVSDPSRIPYDTTDDGKTLRGGTAIVPDMPLQLRLPSGVAGKLEVYRMESSGWTRSALPQDQHLVGTFDLQ